MSTIKNNEYYFHCNFHDECAENYEPWSYEKVYKGYQHFLDQNPFPVRNIMYCQIKHADEPRYSGHRGLWKHVLKLPGVYEHCKDLYENLHHPEVLKSIGEKIHADPNYHRNENIRTFLEHLSDDLPRCKPININYDIIVMQSIYYIVATFTKIKYCENIEIQGLYRQIDFCWDGIGEWRFRIIGEASTEVTRLQQGLTSKPSWFVKAPHVERCRLSYLWTSLEKELLMWQGGNRSIGTYDN